MADLSDILRRVSQSLADVKPPVELAMDDDDVINPGIGRFENASDLLAEHTIKDPDALKSFRISAKNRTLAKLQRETLAALLPELPAPDETLYLLSNANRADNRDCSYSFSSFITHVIELMDCPVVLSVAVWTLHINSAIELIELIRDGKITALNLCVDRYFVTRHFETAQYLASHLLAHPHTMTVFRNHAKAICFSGDTGVVTVTGSGNLSSQPRIEQYTLSTSPEVYAFFNDNLFRWAIAQSEFQRGG